MRSFKKLLVTGARGFIGSAFCHKFCSRYDIVGVDFGGWGSMDQNPPLEVPMINADISDSSLVHSIVDTVRPDAIINFAAESHVDRSNLDDSAFWMSNVFGARNLALAASSHGSWMVQVSTDEVYGDAIASGEPWTEESPINPRNQYAVTKAAAEMAVRVYCGSDRYQLKAIITRGANTIGPRQFPEKAVPKAIWCFTHDQPFPLYRTPARRMWMHVDDHCAGVEAALLNGEAGETYNLSPSANSEEFTQVVVEKIRALLGSGDIDLVGDRDNYDLRYWMSSSKAKSCLGWQAGKNLETTLSETVDWYLKNTEWQQAANVKLLAATRLPVAASSARQHRGIPLPA
jgi:dTDP-glucose 4,6-dehydratase